MLRLVEQRELYEDLPDHVRDRITRIPVSQDNIRPNLIGLAALEIQEEDPIDGNDVEFPFVADLVLARYRPTNIIKSSLINIRLVAILHFHDENTPVPVLATKVENGGPAVCRLRRKLAVHILQIFDMTLAVEQVVQQINQQYFAVFLTEKDLETPVHEWTDKYAFFHNYGFYCSQGKFSENHEISQ